MSTTDDTTAAIRIVRHLKALASRPNRVSRARFTISDADQMLRRYGYKNGPALVREMVAQGIVTVTNCQLDLR